MELERIFSGHDALGKLEREFAEKTVFNQPVPTSRFQGALFTFLPDDFAFATCDTFWNLHFNSSDRDAIFCPLLRGTGIL